MSESQARVEVRGSPQRCPYCHDECSPSENDAVCHACLARHHRSCWEESGRCASCSGARALVIEPGSSPPPRASFPTIEQLPEALRASVEHELADGEKLVWVGQPSREAIKRTASVERRRALKGAASSFVLFVACSLACATFPDALFAPLRSFSPLWTSVVRSLLLPLWALIFLVIFVSSVYRAFVRSRAFMEARGTAYALTPRRAIIFEQNASGETTVRSYVPGELGAMFRKELPDGTGDLVLLLEWTNLPKERGFHGIDRVREVEAMVRATLLAKAV